MASVLDWITQLVSPAGATVGSEVGRQGIEGLRDFAGDVTGRTAARASRDAADAQLQAAREAMAYQQQMFGEGARAIQPYQFAGQQDYDRYRQGVLGGAYDYQPQQFQQGPQMGGFMKSQYQMPGPYNAPTMPQAYQQGPMPGQFQSSQMPGTFQGGPIQQQTQMPGQFDKSQYQMPGQFSYTAKDYQQSPEAKLLMDQGSKAMQRSAAARGGLASGATLAGLQQLGQDITAKDFANQFGRAAQTHQMQLGQARGERGFGYGQHLDERAQAERDRAFGTGLGERERAYQTGRADVGYGRAAGERDFQYGQFMDELGRAERDRAFGYGQSMDARAAAERDRAFGYGQHLDEYGQALGERDFGYGQYMDELGREERDRAFGYGAFQDYQGQMANEMARRQQMMANLGQMGPQMAVNYANLSQGLGGSVGDLYTQMGNAQAAGLVGAANARQQALQNMLNLGGQIAGIAAFSDRRLKTDIKPAGKYKDYNLYTFRYKGGKTYFKGVMADEVQKINPGAVKVIDGYLAVNYGAL